ncbi:MAG TPA: sulfurtransferase TusA family protein [Methylophilus sp.]|nr:sulfurtransferase TusA family protein [Methylophilus sp.]
MLSDKEVDARNLNCPLPILRCKKALNDLAPAQVLKIMATDPGSKKDFDAFCRQTGHTLLELQEADGVFTFWIKKRTA